jgi:hypothetical protein
MDVGITWVVGVGDLHRRQGILMRKLVSDLAKALGRLWRLKAWHLVRPHPAQVVALAAVTTLDGGDGVVRVLVHAKGVRWVVPILGAGKVRGRMGRRTGSR